MFKSLIPTPLTFLNKRSISFGQACPLSTLQAQKAFTWQGEHISDIIKIILGFAQSLSLLGYFLTKKQFCLYKKCIFHLKLKSSSQRQEQRIRKFLCWHFCAIPMVVFQSFFSGIWYQQTRVHQEFRTFFCMPHTDNSDPLLLCFPGTEKDGLYCNVINSGFQY